MELDQCKMRTCIYTPSIISKIRMDEIIEPLLVGNLSESVLGAIQMCKAKVLDKNLKPLLRSQVTRLWNLLLDLDHQDSTVSSNISAHGRQLCYLAMKDLLLDESVPFCDEHILCLMQMATRCERSFALINSHQRITFESDFKKASLSYCYLIHYLTIREPTYTILQIFCFHL